MDILQNFFRINFEELNFMTILLRLAIAMLIGGMIGLERGLNNQPAGMRTYILVCVSSAMVMMTNQFVTSFYSNSDPTRMGAQVISGIGFLGAGMILTTRQDKIKGLTTAAGLWATACLGLAVGIGFYEGAIATGLVLLMILTVFGRLKVMIQKHTRDSTIFLQAKNVDSFNETLRFISDQLVEIRHIEPYLRQSSYLEYRVHLYFPAEVAKDKFFRKMHAIKGINVFQND